MNTINFYNKLIDLGIDFFCGVPDSLLKDLGNCFYDNLPFGKHVIAANEGNAVALAAGYYIATGRVAVVYLQNSGLGNMVNPLLSMADPRVYGIPMIIIIGWRGQNKDAEQHMVQGAITIDLIQTMGYKHVVLSKVEEEAQQQLSEALVATTESSSPYFIVVQEKTFDKYSLITKPKPAGEMSREEALKIVAQQLPSDYFVVSTTGKTSREWAEVRGQLEQNPNKDFLTVGCMGHTSSIALGIALNSKETVVCIDGDGSMLMHLGALVLAGKAQRENFKYILVNNFSHESVGGLPTPVDALDFEALFKAVGFKHYYCASTPAELEGQVSKFLKSTHSVLEIRVKQGSRDDLTRPEIPARQLTQIIRKEFDERK